MAGALLMSVTTGTHELSNGTEAKNAAQHRGPNVSRARRGIWAFLPIQQTPGCPSRSSVPQTGASLALQGLPYSGFSQSRRWWTPALPARVGRRQTHRVRICAGKPPPSQAGRQRCRSAGGVRPAGRPLRPGWFPRRHRSPPACAPRHGSRRGKTAAVQADAGPGWQPGTAGSAGRLQGAQGTSLHSTCSGSRSFPMLRTAPMPRGMRTLYEFVDECVTPPRQRRVSTAPGPKTGAV